MILILFFSFFNFLEADETEAMKAMDKKLFKVQLEKHLENKPEVKIIREKEIAKKDDKIEAKESLNLKKEIRKNPKVKFKYDYKEYDKLLAKLNNIYKIKITQKGNLLIGSKIKNLNFLDKLYGSKEYFYFPLKKSSYNFNETYNFYILKNLGFFLDIFDEDNFKIKEEKGEIFDIFVEEFQEELY